MRGRASQSLQDHLKHAFHVLQYIIVPETQHAITLLHELSRARFVINHLLAMLAAVQLHDQACIWADKISDVDIDLMLSPELPALQTAISQAVPQQLLGVR